MEYRRSTNKWVNGIACLVVVAVLVWLVVWLVDCHKHWHVKVSVEAASLTRFDVDRDGTLHYDLTLTVSLRNRNRATIYYGELQAKASFAGQEFGAAGVPPFTQSPGSTTTIYPELHGVARVADDGVAAKLDRGERVGWYDIDVKLVAGVAIERSSGGRDGGASTKRERHGVEVDCMLKVPLQASGFRRTVCDVKL